MERLVRAGTSRTQTITLTMAAFGACGLERLTVDFESMSGLTGQARARQIDGGPRRAHLMPQRCLPVRLRVSGPDGQAFIVRRW
jgi:hypothetical protein